MLQIVNLILKILFKGVSHEKYIDDSLAKY